MNTDDIRTAFERDLLPTLGEDAFAKSPEGVYLDDNTSKAYTSFTRGMVFGVTSVNAGMQSHELLKRLRGVA